MQSTLESNRLVYEDDHKWGVATPPAPETRRATTVERIFLGILDVLESGGSRPFQPDWLAQSPQRSSR